MRIGDDGLPSGDGSGLAQNREPVVIGFGSRRPGRCGRVQLDLVDILRLEHRAIGQAPSVARYRQMRRERDGEVIGSGSSTLCLLASSIGTRQILVLPPRSLTKYTDARLAPTPDSSR